MLTRRSMFPALFAALPFAQKKPPPQPSTFEGVVNAGDYPTLQAAADAAFGSVANPNGTANVGNNKVLFIPNGVYLPPFSGAPVLDLRYLHGGRIIGAGRFVTKLRQNVAGVPVIRTNGCGYSHFEGFMLEVQSDIGTLFDLNWDGTAGGAALQSNTFTDLEFLGGAYGIVIGGGGFMGSENLFTNCFWILNKTAGLYASNFNALQQSVIGGNFQSCGIGVWAGVGSVPVIHGVGFQAQTECDIRTDGNPMNTMSIAGCRTESQNFIFNLGGHCLKVDACTQTGDGYFLWQAGGQSVISACRGDGRVGVQYWAQVKLENSAFNRQDWLQVDNLWYLPNNVRTACMEVENSWFGTSDPLAFEEIRKRRYQSTNGVDFNVISDYVTA